MNPSHLLIRLELVFPESQLLKVALGLLIIVLLALDQAPMTQALVVGVLLGGLLKQVSQGVRTFPGSL